MRSTDATCRWIFYLLGISILDERPFLAHRLFQLVRRSRSTSSSRNSVIDILFSYDTVATHIFAIIGAHGMFIRLSSAIDSRYMRNALLQLYKP